MKNNLTVTVKFNKDDFVINIIYNLFIDTFNRQNSSVNEVNVYFGTPYFHNNIVNINKRYIKEKLLKFGCTPDETQKFLNLADFKPANNEDLKFEIRGISKDIMVVDQIFDGQIQELKDIQNKLFKKEITYNEYIKLSASEKKLYMQKTYDYECMFNTIKFINAFITRHKRKIIDISVKDEIETDNIDHYTKVIIKNGGPYGSYFVNIDKFYKKANTPLLAIHTIPLAEINQEFKKAFNVFKEKKFTYGLKHNLLQNLDDNIITLYEFKQTNPIINKPQIIQSKYNIAPDGYELSNITYNAINTNYNAKLWNTEAKSVTTSDMLYLINYMTNI